MHRTHLVERRTSSFRVRWRVAATVALIASVYAGAACAEQSARPAPPDVRARTAGGASPALPVFYGDAQTPLPPGIARTAVERRSQNDGVVGSAGFLCGRDPIADGQGAAAMTGYDPHGRFIGAKLSFSF
jgi:hypothetical protein